MLFIPADILPAIAANAHNGLDFVQNTVFFSAKSVQGNVYPVEYLNSNLACHHVSTPANTQAGYPHHAVEEHQQCQVFRVLANSTMQCHGAQSPSQEGAPAMS